MHWCRENGRHNIAYELAWRALSNPNRAASQSVRRQCGNHLKSALQYVYQWQRGDCDDPGDPYGGMSFRCTAYIFSQPTRIFTTTAVTVMLVDITMLLY